MYKMLNSVLTYIWASTASSASSMTCPDGVENAVTLLPRALPSPLTNLGQPKGDSVEGLYNDTSDCPEYLSNSKDSLFKEGRNVQETKRFE